MRVFSLCRLIFKKNVSYWFNKKWKHRCNHRHIVSSQYVGILEIEFTSSVIRLNSEQVTAIRVKVLHFYVVLNDKTRTSYMSTSVTEILSLHKEISRLFSHIYLYHILAEFPVYRRRKQFSAFPSKVAKMACERVPPVRRKDISSDIWRLSDINLNQYRSNFLLWRSPSRAADTPI